jgi:hypothetical protein
MMSSCAQARTKAFEQKDAKGTKALEDNDSSFPSWPSVQKSALEFGGCARPDRSWLN